jgi:hypothetical protein
MDDTLRIIRYLYGEDDAPADVERRLAEDDDLRAEYKALHEVKQHLDERSPQRPDAAVIDQITQKAAEAASAQRTATPAKSAGSERRASREPTRSAAGQRRRWGIAAAAALALVVVVGIWQYPLDQDLNAVLESAPLAADQVQAPSSEASASQSALPAWDEADDVVRLHRHIETLQVRSRPGAWDSGTMPIQRARQPAN